MVTFRLSGGRRSSIGLRRFRLVGLTAHGALQFMHRFSTTAISLCERRNVCSQIEIARIQIQYALVCLLSQFYLISFSGPRAHTVPLHTESDFAKESFSTLLNQTALDVLLCPLDSLRPLGERLKSRF